MGHDTEHEHHRQGRSADAGTEQFFDHIASARSEVLRWARRRYDPHRAEDVAQEAVLKTMLAARRGSPIAAGSSSAVAAYVQTAARSVAVDELRERNRHHDLAAAGWYPDPVDPTGCSERFWTGRRWGEAVRGRADGKVSVPPPVGLRPQLDLTRTLDPEQFPHGAEPTVDPVELQRVAAEELWARLSSLAPRQALALRLSASGYSYLEIAEHLRISPGAANALLVHARARLRDQLAAE